MDLNRVNRKLTYEDLFPKYVQEANQLGFSSEVFMDAIPEGRLAIGTHSGCFHSDDALACSMLRSLPEYRNHVIVRTRNMEVLEQCDIVVDVGGIYDVEKKRFDHHQKGFYEVFDEKHKTKMSSAGLIFKHYGKDIIQAVSQKTFDASTLDMLHKKLYDSFVEEVDGVDNGIDPSMGEANYEVTTTLSSRVKRLAVPWTEEWTVDKELDGFRLAMGMMLGEFTERLHSLVDILLPARVIVEKALDEAKEVHPSEQIIVMEESCPFMEHLLEIEQERGIEGRTQFAVIFNKDNTWRIRAINVEKNSFELRREILPACLGLRDDECSRVSGIPDCVFVHINGFLGINKTKEGALKMAIQSLEWYVCSKQNKLRMNKPHPVLHWFQNRK